MVLFLGTAALLLGLTAQIAGVPLPACGVPEARQQFARIPSTLRTPFDAFKFFMLQPLRVGPDPVGILHRRLSSAAPQGRWDYLLPPSYSQYLTDAMLMAALRNSTHRTHDPTFAQLLIVDAVPFASFVCAQLFGSGAVKAHRARMKAMSEAIASSPEWRAGVRVLVVMSGWDTVGVFGKALARLLDDDRVIIATVDRAFDERAKGHAVVVPYVPTQYPEIGPAPPLATRNRTLFFQGNLHRHHQRQPPAKFWECPTAVPLVGRRKRHRKSPNPAYRRALLELQRWLPDSATIQEVDFHRFSTPAGHQNRGWPGVLQESMGAMERSTLCLCPEGDTSTARRLYDSLARGCIPVVLADPSDISANLPFRSLIDWSEVAIFLDSLHCVKDQLEGVAQHLQWHLDNRTRLEAYWAAGQRAFREHLQFTGPQCPCAVSLLHEIYATLPLRWIGNPYWRADDFRSATALYTNDAQNVVVCLPPPLASIVLPPTLSARLQQASKAGPSWHTQSLQVGAPGASRPRPWMLQHAAPNVTLLLADPGVIKVVGLVHPVLRLLLLYTDRLLFRNEWNGIGLTRRRDPHSLQHVLWHLGSMKRRGQGLEGGFQAQTELCGVQFYRPEHTVVLDDFGELPVPLLELTDLWRPPTGLSQAAPAKSASAVTNLWQGATESPEKPHGATSKPIPSLRLSLNQPVPDPSTFEHHETFKNAWDHLNTTALQRVRSSSASVCQYFTPAAFNILEQLYRQDMDMFRFKIRPWMLHCRKEWCQQRRDAVATQSQGEVPPLPQDTKQPDTSVQETAAWVKGLRTYFKGEGHRSN